MTIVKDVLRKAVQNREKQLERLDTLMERDTDSEISEARSKIAEIEDSHDGSKSDLVVKIKKWTDLEHRALVAKEVKTNKDKEWKALKKQWAAEVEELKKALREVED